MPQKVRPPGGTSDASTYRVPRPPSFLLRLWLLVLCIAPLAYSGCTCNPSHTNKTKPSAEAAPQPPPPEPLPAPALIVTEPAPPQKTVLPPRQIQILVVDSESRPIEDALVHFLDGSDGIGHEVITDVQGLAVQDTGEIADSYYQVWAEKGPLISGLITVQAQPADTALIPTPLPLAPGTHLTGRVHREALGVVASIQMLPKGHNHLPFYSTSSPDGYFNIPVLPRGQWEVSVTSQSHSQPQAAFVSANDSEFHVDIPMTANASASGEIVNGKGNPVPGALVHFIALGATQEREAPQQWSTLQTGLRWVHPLTGKRYLPIRSSRRFGAKRSGIRPSECGGGHCGVDLGGTRGWPILSAADGRVVVASDDDRGKSGRYVAIAHAGGMKTFYMHMDSVSPQLKIGSAIPAGTVLGTLGRSGIQRSEPHLHFALSREREGRIVFINPEPMLRIATVRPPPPKDLEQLPDFTLPPPLVTSSEDHQPLRSGHDGRFSQSNLAAGSYRIEVTHPDYAVSQSAPFVLKPGAKFSKLRIVLNPGKRLAGIIVGPDGPILGAWIRAYQGQGESRRQVALANADTEGRFALRPAKGILEVEVGAAGFGVHRTTISTKSAGLEELLFTLSKFDSELRGQVRDPNGAPFSAAAVQILSGPAARGRKVQCDAYGFFRFEKVPKGGYKIQIRSEKYPDFEVSLKSDGSPEFVLRQGGSMRLVFRDSHSGGPIAGTRITAKSPDDRSTTAVTDALGKVEFSALTPGNWTLTVDSEAFVFFERKQKVRASTAIAKEVEYSLQRGAILAGVVLDHAGDRASGAQVWVGKTKTKSDSTGRFRLVRVPVGKVSLHAKVGPSSTSQALELFAGDEQVTLELTLPATATEDTAAEDTAAEE